MTRLNSEFVLRRTSERLTAGAAAIAATVLMMLTVQVRATETDPTPPSVSVQYTEAAFVTREEATNVYRTLKSAARKVCGLDTANVVTLDEYIRAKACVSETLTDVVRRLNRPMLTSVHDASARTAG
jgi:UrcA family protein